MIGMLDPETALALVLEHTPRWPVRRRPCSVELVGRAVLAEAVTADRDYPPFNRAIMDGVAVLASQAGRQWPVLGEVAAGAQWPGVFDGSGVVEIMTGAPVPEGADAVVQKELLTWPSGPASGSVRLPDQIRPGQNIMPRSREAAAGATVLEPGQWITPQVLAVLAFVGWMEVDVLEPPRAMVIVTGNELVRDGAVAGPSQIRDSNGPLLEAMLYRAGLRDIQLTFAGDDPSELDAQLRKAEDRELIILTGGVSAGKHDYVPQVLERLGAQTIFHKVRQRPGKPLLFATRGSGNQRQLIFGLPGNPLSCQLGMHRYVANAIRHGLGFSPRPRYFGRLLRALEFKEERTVFQAALAAQSTTGAWQLEPLLGKGSGDLFTAARANALIEFKPGNPPRGAGDEIEFEFLD